MATMFRSRRPEQQAEWNAKNEEHEKEMKTLRKQMKDLAGAPLEKMKAKLEEMKEQGAGPAAGDLQRGR